MCPARRFGGDAKGVEPGCRSLTFGEPGAGDLQILELGDGRAQHAAEGGLTARDVGPGGPALLVGMCAKGYHDSTTGDAVVGLHAVTGGPDMRRAGAQVVVDDDAPGLAHADACGTSQCHVGAHAQPDHHQVGRNGPCRAFDSSDVPVDHGETGDCGAESQVDAGGAHRVRDSGGHVAIEHGAHGRVEPFDHCYVEAACEQALRDLQSDVAGADHHGASGPSDKPLLYLGGVFQRSQLQDTFGVYARPRRRDAGCAGGDEEFVVVHGRLPVLVEVANRHGRSLGVDGGDLVTDSNVDAVGPMLFRGPGDKPVWCTDEPADQVGKAASGVGGTSSTLKGHDLELVDGCHPTRLRGCGHPCSVTTNDHQ